ncbi:TPA: 30S ribosomal protein S3 [Candidatus Uhrbacteria bacterium]|uniref:Small ribosomal subunit protein uS3 n=2 Tax=Candidatus Uhriibacteriota TaxID=1752732 RepID=A0A0G1Q877_9BACT|nr:MAG: 30S ribosomal protein S3 [Candidatus Uhrbacteria bacterium GW2011_GWF2_46_218]KKU41189.1 MAG: 30S ribosomal protein S3 [Candidatus Uhrbacteria bacterium GW2011_GWE2_46_68]HBK34036.1 30S ribosomal protein S3 [Candidatus Uhrbacteria bacterium]HCB18886.1 30S ribosomal protein S3 [Candidatus Uhrbacteria bacterium]
MGHKVNPKAFRIGVTRGWESVWFSKNNYRTFLQEDIQIREYLQKKLKEALVERIEVERSRQDIKIWVHTAKPGVVIGRAGSGIEELTKEIRNRFYRGKKVSIQMNVKEVTQPGLSAQIVAQQMAFDIEKRMPFRRVMKTTIERVLKSRAEGIKVTMSGRLNGAEIARTETIATGKIPLQNLRADIDYAHVMALTIYGAVGVRVWINRGEIFEKTRQASQE